MKTMPYILSQTVHLTVTKDLLFR